MKALPCPFDIELFLAGELTPAEELTFEAHLDSCQLCRQKLSDQAADARSWSDAKRFLSLPAGHITVACSNSRKATTSSPECDMQTDTQAIVHQVLHLLAPTDDPHMLGRVGQYEISGVIGAGGMGIVFKGVDRSLGRVVAIKLMAPHLATSGVAKARFLREAQAAAGIVHPNVIDIYGVAEFSTIPYLVMPYIRGSSLQKRVQDHGPLATEDVLRIGLQIASGLTAAHAQGIVHRDIKPANILVGEGTDRVVITDFGLARSIDDASLTHSGAVAGTPQYMSPEQARGERVDDRSDLFSLGSVIYFLCTGHPPFRSETLYGVLQKISAAKVRDMREIQPSVPAWLQNLVAKLLSPDPDCRYASASVVAVLFEQALAHYQHPFKHELPQELVKGVDNLEPTPNRLSRLTLHWLSVFALIACGLIGALIYAPWNSSFKQDSSVLQNTKEFQPASESKPNFDQQNKYNSGQPTGFESLGLASTANGEKQKGSNYKPHYNFELGKTIGFLLTLIGPERLQETPQLHGMILLKPFSIDEHRVDLATSVQLESRMVRPAQPMNEPGNRSHFHHVGNEGITAMITLDPLGKMLAEPRQLSLPYDTGSPLQYVLPELDQGAVPRINIGNRKLSLRSPRGGEFVFDLDEGQVESFDWKGSSSESGSAGSPVDRFHLTVTRLSDQEVAEWIGVEEESRLGQQTFEQIAQGELEECSSDLSEQRRVIYWLRRLDHKLTCVESEQLAAAIEVLCEHTLPLYRSLADRLRDRIPPDLGSPFKIIEP